MKTLIFATEFEAKPFIAGLQEIDKGHYEGKYRVLISGPGLVNMAAATSLALEQRENNSIYNLGIAGAVSENLNTGDIILPDVFSVYSSTAVPEQSQSIWQQSYPDIGSGDIKLLSSLHPVWNEKDKQKLKDLGADLLDMESYAFAKVCAEKGCDFKVIKAISDNLQKASQESFLKNAQKAINSLFEYFEKL